MIAIFRRGFCTFQQNLFETAAAFSAVVNGGTWHTPTIVKGTLEEDGTITPLEGYEKKSEQILSESTSAAMRDLLQNNRGYKVGQGIDREGYDIGGKVTTDFPVTRLLKDAKPVYKTLPGWKEDITGIREYEKLPENCRKYIEFIENEIGYPITMVSNGPSREDIIYRKSALKK